MTLDQARQAYSQAEDDASKALGELDQANSNLKLATEALHPEFGQALSRERRDQLEGVAYQAKSIVVRKQIQVRRTNEVAKEAQERLEAFTPHGVTLQKLEKVRASVANAEQDLNEVGADFLARFSSEVQKLGKLLAEADALYVTLPAAVRFRFLSHPSSAAPVWGGARPGSTDLLVTLARALNGEQAIKDNASGPVVRPGARA
jgi:hypothetical protein